MFRVHVCVFLALEHASARAVLQPDCGSERIEPKRGQRHLAWLTYFISLTRNVWVHPLRLQQWHKSSAIQQPALFIACPGRFPTAPFSCRARAAIARCALRSWNIFSCKMQGTDIFCVQSIELSCRVNAESCICMRRPMLLPSAKHGDCICDSSSFTQLCSPMLLFCFA